MKKEIKFYDTLCVPIIVFLLLTITSCKEQIIEPNVAMSSVTEYYVSVSGNDYSSGTQTQPFRTINHALSVAGPGATIFVRQGTYVEKVNFTSSGTSGLPITLKSFPNEKATISGCGLSVTGHEALMRLSSISWINIEDLEICDLRTSSGGNMVDGILINGASSNITIKNCHIHNIENNASPSVGREGHAINVIGNSTLPITSISIENNIIHDNNTGTSENLTINGYVSDFVVSGNQIYNGENIAICIAGGYLGNSNPLYNYARNGVIKENNIWNIDGRTGPVPTLQSIAGTIGIYIDGARYITVEKNRVRDSDRGIGLVSENNDFPTQYCIVRNNFIFCNRAEGILMGGYSGYTGGGTIGCIITNNTLYENARELGYYGEEVGEIRLNTNCSYNEIHNNIIYARYDRGMFVRKNDSTGIFNGINYNLYYTTGSSTKWLWNGAVCNTFASWKGSSGGDSNSLFQNPQFLSLSPFSLNLSSSSPAINIGYNGHGASAGLFDIDNQARYNGIIDIGADEFY
ncbi:right-handed parallel beta-helix repeat-containing protein [Pedobacter aquae]|nr:right-handed parallel beta-helix repeat-containing protein [Pedobacter aquae]